MTILWDLIPNTRLGSVILGDDVSVYIDSLGAFIDKEEKGYDHTNWYRYSLPDFDIYIDVENNKVVSVTSYSVCLYKDNNIVGLNISELENILGCAADEIGESVHYEDGDVRVPYEFFDLGLQVWTSKGEVTSVSCLTYRD